MVNKFDPDFFVTPYVLIQDDKLQPSDLVIYGAIYFLSQLRDKKCTGSNELLSELTNIHVRTVQSSLARLEERGYIKRHFADEDKKVRAWIEPLVIYGRVRSKIQEVRSDDRGGYGQTAVRIKTEINKEKKNASVSQSSTSPSSSIPLEEERSSEEDTYLVPIDSESGEPPVSRWGSRAKRGPKKLKNNERAFRALRILRDESKKILGIDIPQKDEDYYVAVEALKGLGGKETEQMIKAFLYSKKAGKDDIVIRGKTCFSSHTVGLWKEGKLT